MPTVKKKRSDCTAISRSATIFQIKNTAALAESGFAQSEWFPVYPFPARTVDKLTTSFSTTVTYIRSGNEFSSSLRKSNSSYSHRCRMHVEQQSYLELFTMKSQGNDQSRIILKTKRADTNQRFNLYFIKFNKPI